ncbi:MAG: response regulator transcription factor [Clostridia bacterium]|nr:response regulator transcription factor [Clostridia bacterium]
MLNFVVCDDNLNILNKFSKMLESIFLKYNYDASVVFQSTDADSILNFVNSNKTDVLILDINLKSNITGLQLAEKVREHNKKCYIIFTTGHLEYAIVAYKLKTFDYLPKPITYERLEDTVTRLFEDINGLPKRYIKIDNKNTLIDENEINYIKREGMKLVFHTDNKDYETYTSLSKIQENLPSNFIRCHKSYVANVNKIVNVEPISNTLFFANKSTCDIGPKYKSTLMEVMKNNGNIK